MENARSFDLVAFDMDGVLVDYTSCWTWVHHHFGVDNEPALLSFVSGEIDDMEFMRRDIALWRGRSPQLDLDGLKCILEPLPFNEGIGEHIDLMCGIGGTAFSNANAYLGVGDSSVAEGATQTDLQASTNKLYKAMSSGFPSRSNQTVTFQSVFGSGDANFAWNEFTVANGSSGSAKNLNRKVSAQGTKTSGQTWTLSLAITFS